MLLCTCSVLQQFITKSYVCGDVIYVRNEVDLYGDTDYVQTPDPRSHLVLRAQGGGGRHVQTVARELRQLRLHPKGRVYRTNTPLGAVQLLRQ